MLDYNDNGNKTSKIIVVLSEYYDTAIIIYFKL